MQYVQFPFVKTWKQIDENAIEIWFGSNSNSRCKILNFLCNSSMYVCISTESERVNNTKMKMFDNSSKIVLFVNLSS